MTSDNSGKEVYLVTSALPYVNGVKHIGNVAGSLLPADVFSRFLRLTGRDVLFVCGTDDHGAACELAAIKEGLSPSSYSEKYHSLQKKIYEGWNLSFDIFSRTSNQENHRTTQEIFKKIHDNGLIEQKETRQAYCLADKRFLQDRFIEGQCPHCGFDGARGDQCEKCGRVLDATELKKPRCNLCGKGEIEFRQSRHLFFQLQKLSPQLKEWISKQHHWPANARNFALQWIEGGLKERAITRDLQWGVKVPLDGFEDKVFYVWFDAPIGYISFTKEWAARNGKDWERYWRNKNAKIVHVLGKDNVAFHTVIWPGMLLASGYAELPYEVKSLEFLNLEGRKFSTSRNWGITSDEAIGWFPADYWRYYLLSILPEQSDADFTFQEFARAVNSDLADTFGNLAHRCLTFINSNYGGKVPQPVTEGELSEGDKQFLEEISSKIDRERELFESYRWQEALRCGFDIARAANKYFNDGAPWKNVKGFEEEKKRAATTVFLTANCLRSLGIVLFPFIPSSCEKLFSYLDLGKVESHKWDEAKKLALPAGHQIAPAEAIAPLFAKIDAKQLEKVKAAVGARRGTGK